LSDMQRRAPLVWHCDVDASWRAWVATSAVPHSALAAVSDLLSAERARCAAPIKNFAPAPSHATMASQARRQHGHPPPPVT
jgi:hypothetical protein